MIEKTGNTTPKSGIYKCCKCGNEITSVLDKVVPPCTKCSGTKFVLIRETK